MSWSPFRDADEVVAEYVQLRGDQDRAAAEDAADDHIDDQPTRAEIERDEFDWQRERWRGWGSE